MTLQIGETAPGLEADATQGHKELFPGGWRSLRPCIRIVPQPH